jgi:hypothetical protein
MPGSDDVHTPWQRVPDVAEPIVAPTFPPTTGPDGYRCDDVDALVVRVGTSEPEQLRSWRLRRASPGSPGYDSEAVDRFVEDCARRRARRAYGRGAVTYWPKNLALAGYSRNQAGLLAMVGLLILMILWAPSRVDVITVLGTVWLTIYGLLGVRDLLVARRIATCWKAGLQLPGSGESDLVPWAEVDYVRVDPPRSWWSTRATVRLRCTAPERELVLAWHVPRDRAWYAAAAIGAWRDRAAAHGYWGDDAARSTVV